MFVSMKNYQTRKLTSKEIHISNIKYVAYPCELIYILKVFISEVGEKKQILILDLISISLKYISQ